MIVYSCPNCECSIISEYDSGAFVRHTLAFNRVNRKIIRTSSEVLEEGNLWWACFQCNFKIPVETEEELFQWITEHDFVELK